MNKIPSLYRLQSKSTGRWFRKGEHFTACEADATPLGPVELAYVRYCYDCSPAAVNTVISAPMVECLPVAMPLIYVNLEILSPVWTKELQFCIKRWADRLTFSASYRYDSPTQHLTVTFFDGNIFQHERATRSLTRIVARAKRAHRFAYPFENKA